MKKILQKIFIRIARSLGIVEIQNRLDGISSAVSKLEGAQIDTTSLVDAIRAVQRHNDDQMSHLHAVVADLRSLLDEAQRSVVDHAASHAELLTSELRELVFSEISVIRRDLSNVRRSITSSPGKPATGVDARTSRREFDQSLYVSLEDHFRGDPIEVEKRQRSYLSFLPSSITDSQPVLDIGCGRGEWLRILQEHRIPCVGIDNNPVSVAECRESGLKVVQIDLVTHLKSTAVDAYSSVTMFQVLEHLPVETLFETLSEIHRVLKPGGVFIGEIPNIETLRVGASTFWIDPTHERPLFPGLLVFLARQVGFTSVDGKYSSPLATLPELPELPQATRDTISELFNAINGPGDFALIAVK